MALTIAFTACSPVDGEPPQLGTAPATQDGDLPITDVIAIVTSVTDGDSFIASVDGDEIEVRLLGINAPELEECFGIESTDWLTATIDGKKIGLAPETELDQFDRVLARAVIDDTYVNRAAVATGHALVVSAAEADHDVLIEAEDAARLAGTGFWGDDICGASGAKASLEIVDVDFNPPGPDDVETVTIENTGVEAVSLSGFILRDESSTNRYEMPLEVLQPGARHVVMVASCEPFHPHGPVWCSDEPVWNNDGDTALLLDRYGRIVAFLRY